jgi:hypothetical protein
MRVTRGTICLYIFIIPHHIEFCSKLMGSQVSVMRCRSMRTLAKINLKIFYSAAERKKQDFANALNSFLSGHKAEVQSLLVLLLAPCTFFMYLLVIMTAVL